MARLLHTRIRVGDFQGSIDWYCQHLGFNVISQTNQSPAGNYVAHLELPGNEHTLELTWSPDYEVNVPEDLMHLAISVPDLVKYCDTLENNGVEIWPGDWRDKFHTGRKMAFIDDPDGYEIELLEDKEKS